MAQKFLLPGLALDPDKIGLSRGLANLRRSGPESGRNPSPDEKKPFIFALHYEISNQASIDVSTISEDLPAFPKWDATAHPLDKIPLLCYFLIQEERE